MFRTRRLPVLLFFIILMGALTGCDNNENLRKGLHLKSTAENNRENFNQAVAHLKQFLKDNPQTQKREKVEEILADTYFEWAESEKQLKRWESGIELMQTILNDYPDTLTATKVEDALPEYLLEYAVQQSHDGNFLESLKILKRLILNFPASGFAQQGRELRKNIGIIAFNSGTDIYVMNADGTKLRKVAESSIDPSISPDGTRIAYIKIQKPTDRSGYLFISNIDGRKAKRLLDKPIASEPTFSPDGSHILITKGDAFQTVDLTGKTIEAYFDIKDFDTIGSYNPSGKKVVAFLQNPKGRISRLCVTENFEEYIELTTTENNSILDAAWSLDDLRIVYVTQNGLHTISPDGENRQDFLLAENLDGMEFRSVDVAPTGYNIIFIGKKKTDDQFHLYTATLNKEVTQLSYQPTKDSLLPEVSPGRVSWGMGYLRY